MRKNADFQPASTPYSRQPARRVKGYTRVDTLSMKGPCTHRGCRDLVFASVEDVTEKLPTVLLVDILGCGSDGNAVADELSPHFQSCSEAHQSGQPPASVLPSPQLKAIPVSPVWCEAADQPQQWRCFGRWIAVAVPASVQTVLSAD